MSRVHRGLQAGVSAVLRRYSSLYLYGEKQLHTVGAEGGICRVRDGQRARALAPRSGRAPEPLRGHWLREKLEMSEYTGRPARRLAWLVERPPAEKDFASCNADWLLCLVNSCMVKTLNPHTAVQEFNSPRNERGFSSLLAWSGSFGWPLCPFSLGLVPCECREPQCPLS